MSLDAFYETDPINYLKYNIIDVMLTKKLNEKLQIIDLHNSLRRDMKTPMTISLRGSSALFDTFFSYDLDRNDKFVRYAITQEIGMYITASDLQEIPKPIVKGVKWDVFEVNLKTYKTIINKFVGAYVKDAAGKVYSEDKGIYLDLDATALYPSMMLQNNISFDTYYGRILDPVCYSLFRLLSVLGTDNTYIPDLANKIWEGVVPYVEKLNPKKPKKNEYRQALFYIIMFKLLKLKKINRPLSTLLSPQNREDYLALKLYLIPLLDLWNSVSPKHQEYNTFAHDYILNNNISEYDELYIIENILSPKLRVIKINSQEIDQYIKTQNVSMNITGCLFYTHAYHIGLVYQFLNDRLDMRNVYKNKMYEYKIGSEEYNFYNARQLTMKVNANSSYGLMGMSAFRFSNKFLAESITISGRVTLKVAQKFGDVYIRTMEAK